MDTIEENQCSFGGKESLPLFAIFMKRTITFLVLFLGLISMAQPTNQIDEQGRKQGIWKKYFAEGGVRYEGAFKDDKEVGTFTFYYPDGVVAAIKTYGDEDNVCFAQMFHTNGNKSAEGKYVGQEKEGEWKYYSPREVLISIENFENGVLQGEARDFYPDQQLAELRNYVDGVQHGVWKQFYEDGQKKLIGSFEEGLVHGEVQTFDFDGSIATKGRYHKGRKDGVWVVYEEGLPKIKETYEKGELISTEEFE